MEELGYYDGEMVDTSDPRWSTRLGLHVHAYLIREKLAEASVILFLSSEKRNTDGLSFAAGSELMNQSNQEMGSRLCA